VDQSAIAHFEADRTRPSDEILRQIAHETGFPVGFFQQPPGPPFPLGSLLFRAHADMTAREKAEAHRQGELVYEAAWRLRQRVVWPDVRLPRGIADPTTAADLTRSAFGLAPNTPIKHLIDSTERAGVLVLLIPADLDRRDAFSAWVGEARQQPVIAVSDGRPGDRLRSSVAHEIGHLVMHFPLNHDPATVEDEAAAFAAQLLLPESAIRHEITLPLTLESLVPLKKRWGVSMQMLIRRARDVGLVSERQYRYLFQLLSRRGWRKVEPIEMTVERPRALRKMVELVYGQPFNYSKIATDLRLSPLLTKRIIEAHAEKAGAKGPSPQRKRAPVLRLADSRGSAQAS
jgi:Zn-dependent peptidase ImmA (M78 family)